MRTFLLFALVATLLDAQSTAERMGYGPKDRVLMVHADDLGMSHTVNVAAWKR